MTHHNPEGPLLLGHIISLVLHGVLTVQLYLYYAAFPRDSVVIKALVYTVYLIETARSILMAYDAYEIFAVGFTDREALYLVHHIWFTCCVANGILAFIVQMLYAYRLKILSASYTWGFIVSLLSFIQLAGAVMAGVGAKLVGNFADHTTYELVGYIISKVSTAVCDVLIAILMTFYLLRLKKLSRMAEDTITRIIQLVVEAGTLTSLFAIADVAAYFIEGQSGSSWAFRLIVGKLYTNSMMVIFNNRFSIRNNRFDESEATWKSNFLVSISQVVEREVDTPISFNNGRDSAIKSQGGTGTKDLQTGTPGSSRTSSISADDQVIFKDRTDKSCIADN